MWAASIQNFKNFMNRTTHLECLGEWSENLLEIPNIPNSQWEIALAEQATEGAKVQNHKNKGIVVGWCQDF